MSKTKFEDFDLMDFEDKDSQDNFSLAEVFNVLKRNLKWFVLSLIACLLAGYIFIRKTPKTYRSSATVLIKDDKQGGGLGDASVFQDIFQMGTSNVENEIGFFKSKRLMYEVAKQLRLDYSYKIKDGLKDRELFTSAPLRITFPDAVPEQSISLKALIKDENQVEIYNLVSGAQEFPEKQTITVGDTVTTPAGRMVVQTTSLFSPEYVGKTLSVQKNNLDAVAGGYQARVQVELAAKQSSLVKLTLEDENLDRANSVLNTLIEVYKADAIDDKNQVGIYTDKFIKERIEIIGTELSGIDERIEAYKKKNRLTDISSESSLFLGSTGQLETLALSVENQLNMAQYLKAHLQEHQSGELIPASIGIEDPGIQGRITEYNDLLIKRNKLIENSSVTNPVVEDINVSLSAMRLSILKALDNVIAGLNIQVRNMKEKQSENIRRIESIPTQQRLVTSIERDQKIKQELYLFLLNKKEENELQLSITQSNCRIVDPANGSSAPVAPKKMQVMMISFLLGLLLPAGVLYASSLFNTHLYTKKELKKAVSVPVLGEIPYEKAKHEKDIVVKEGNRGSVNEAFKIMQDNLEFLKNGKDGRGYVIQITSANPNSGKTFITLNLGISMSFTHAKVLVIDLDLRKGGLTRQLDMTGHKKGVSGYLVGKVTDVDDIIHEGVAGQKIDFIGSGPLPPNPAELLKSDRLEELLNQLKERYDYILLDNPPYGLIVDAAICARLSDQMIYVVRSGQYDKRMLPELQELYSSGKVKNMGVLLNAVDEKKLGYGYYGYGYGYGYGSGSDREKAEKRGFLKKLFG